MSYIKAHRSLALVEANGDEIKRQGHFISQQSLTPVLIDQNSLNSFAQKLYALTKIMRDDCYRQDKSSDEIACDFIVGIEKIRSDYVD